MFISCNVELSIYTTFNLVASILCVSIVLNSYAIWSQVSVQVKSYARMNGQRNENDKGYASFTYTVYVAGSYDNGYVTYVNCWT